MVVFILVILFLAVGIWGVREINKTLTGPDVQPPSSKAKKKRTFITEDFKIPKRISDGDDVNAHAGDNKFVSFYEKGTFAGEGFLHKDNNKMLWDVIDQNRDLSVKVIRTEKTKAYIKIAYQ